jgi:hypothetical protein
MSSKYFKIYQKGKEVIETLKGTGKKTRGYMEKDPNVRAGIAKGLKDMKKKGFIGLKKKKIPKDLSYLKGTLKD